jgi:hypothetical protein
VVAALAPSLLSVESGSERTLLAAAAGLDIAVQMRCVARAREHTMQHRIAIADVIRFRPSLHVSSPDAVFAHLAPVLATLTRRLALMHGGGRRPEDDPSAAALIPTAAAAKAYIGLLARAALHAPSALWELCGNEGALTEEVTTVWSELASLRHMEELLMIGASSRGRVAVGGGAAPSAYAEERHLAALALCTALRAAAGVPGAGAAAVAPGAATSGPAAVLRNVGGVLALALQALNDLRALTGDAHAAGPLPMEAWHGTGSAAAATAAASPIDAAPPDEEEGALPNQVDVAAYRLSQADPIHVVSLREAAVGALRAARAALGDERLRAAVEAEEKLSALPPPRQALLNALLAEA